MLRILKNKSCHICGSIFTPTSSCQKYCSSCREIGNKKHRQDCRKANIDYIKKRDLEYHYKNKDKRNEYCKEWYVKNRDKKIEMSKQYRELNKEEINKKDRIRNKTRHRIEYRKTKRQNDVQYKLSLWLRNQVFRCLNNKKNIGTNEIINYS